MKEKEAKRIAAKKRLEEKNKKKTEEENAMRKGEALQVSAPGVGVGGHDSALGALQCWA